MLNFFESVVYRINWQAVSVVLCFLGTFILAIPFLKREENIDNDEIIEDRREGSGDKEKYFYTRRGFLNDRLISLWGLGFLGIGFFIQLVLSFL